MAMAWLIHSLLLASCGVHGLRPTSYDYDLDQDEAPTSVIAVDGTFNHSATVGSLMEEGRTRNTYTVPHLYCHATDKVVAILRSGVFVGTTKEMKRLKIGIKDLIAKGTQPFLNGEWKGKKTGHNDKDFEEWGAPDPLTAIPASTFARAQTYFIDLGPDTKLSIATARLRAGGFDDIEGREARGGGEKDVRGVLCFSGHNQNGDLMIQPETDTKPYPHALGAYVPLKDLDLRFIFYHTGDAETKGVHNIEVIAKHVLQDRPAFQNDPDGTLDDDGHVIKVPVFKKDMDGNPTDVQETIKQEIVIGNLPPTSLPRAKPVTYGDVDATAVLSSLENNNFANAFSDLEYVEADDNPPGRFDKVYKDMDSNLVVDV
mmetsp:Transcript_48675/g.115664  ORF Transcript_48675/g.115664 Transcript_48675/m.115664 type:complete len:372 (-) Transcript_48675:298-1413(-)|eukprot:CAMPEP_0178428244 /NCGR_PEP_ID=MMETSP0689_2-20121128/30175_1 /TAXON_ID=160604 /ORGANISM="Amphidinium massartii, Strain CS-259" /LENGTH=371 /DNA_ID=CAMNT_0020050005 /DNA_START=138 /DNA_END=1253 /DNA_ORIENTATION=-